MVPGEAQLGAPDVVLQDLAYKVDELLRRAVDLPQEGITGNDHFIFQDLNNDVIADHIENWIQKNVK